MGEACELGARLVEDLVDAPGKKRAQLLKIIRERRAEGLKRGPVLLEPCAVLGVRREGLLDLLDRRLDLVGEDVFPPLEIRDLLEVLSENVRPCDLARGEDFFRGIIRLYLKRFDESFLKRLLDVVIRMGGELGQADELVIVERVERTVDERTETFHFGGFENGFAVIIRLERGFGFVEIEWKLNHREVLGAFSWASSQTISSDVKSSASFGSGKVFDEIPKYWIRPWATSVSRYCSASPMRR